MNEAISKWKAFCEGGTNYDSSDFIGLLAGKWTDDDLNEILRLVPLKEAVIARLKEVYNSSQDGNYVYLRPKKEDAGTLDDLATSIERFIDSQRRYLLQFDISSETRKWLERSDIKVTFVSTDELRSFDPNDDVMPFIREWELEYQKYRPEAMLDITTADSVEYRVMSGINEALYGLAADYHLAWFVMSPLFATEIDYRQYFEFWRKGGECFLTDSQILVASIWGEVR